ncbi:MAG: hypothetical protein ACRDD1_15180, partial [Planctomycetia bacterium]
MFRLMRATMGTAALLAGLTVGQTASANPGNRILFQGSEAQAVQASVGDVGFAAPAVLAPPVAA